MNGAEAESFLIMAVVIFVLFISGVFGAAESGHVSSGVSVSASVVVTSTPSADAGVPDAGRRMCEDPEADTW